MKNSLVIMKNELRNWLNKPAFYLLMGVLFFWVGFYTWFFYGESLLYDTKRMLETFFYSAYWGFALFIPFLTLNLFFEERKKNTLNLLMSKPISISQLIFGKFLAGACLLLFFIALTCIYSFGLYEYIQEFLKNLVLGYVLLFLIGLVYLTISLLVSLFFNTYGTCLFVSYLIISFFHILFNLMGMTDVTEISLFFNYLGFQKHLNLFVSGGFALSSIVYLFSLLFFGLSLLMVKLQKDYK